MGFPVGSKVCYRTTGRGTFHCERCGGDRPYLHRSGRRWAHVLGIPVAVLGPAGEHLRCAACGTCYRVELLAVPTTDQMQVALLAGTAVAVLAMLAADGEASRAARGRAVEAIRAAGAPDCDEARLGAALADARPVVPGSGLAIGLRPGIEALGLQFDACAREWFLGRIVGVGLADGPLSTARREVAGTIARYLGLTQSRAEAVISLTEEAAQAG
jgi:hypothetical protein